jgi:hypothetical protein
MLIALGFSWIAGFLSFSAHADSILYQSILDFHSDPNSNSVCSSCAGTSQAYAGLTLANNSDVSGVIFNVSEWPLWEGVYGPVNITVSIFSAGQLEQALWSQTFAPKDYSGTTQAHADPVIWSVTLGWTGLQLGAGAYQISFFNPNNLQLPTYDTGQELGFAVLGSPTAYNRIAAVPAPLAGAGLPGLVVAITGLIAYRRRRKAWAHQHDRASASPSAT